MVCLSITENTLEKNTRLIKKYHDCIDLLELRVDLLHPEYQVWVLIAQWAWETKKTYQLPMIFTVRLPHDGGSWKGASHQRDTLLLHAITSGIFKWVDIETSLTSIGPHTIKEVISLAESYETTIILSSHNFERDSLEYHTSSDKPIAPWTQNLIDTAIQYPSTIVKAAIACEQSSYVCAFFEQCRILSSHIAKRYVVAAMGIMGLASRILTSRTGSLWTFSSEGLPHLGHVNPHTLHNTYQYTHITPDTDLYAIIGKPVLHSLSPSFHNEQFSQHQVLDPTGLKECTHNKVYIHMPLDNCSSLPNIARLINMRGISVTIPFKEDIISHLTDYEHNVSLCRACNTVIIDDKGQWHGYNTDIPGFLTPLQKTLAEQHKVLETLSITIIGAGGTARALALVLSTQCTSLLVVNRTLEKAQHIVTDLHAHNPDSCVLSYGSLSDYDKIASHSDIIVQASSVGLKSTLLTPLPQYHFKGHEIVYDVIYDPLTTKIMKDAQQKGCTTISGISMFHTQAMLQSSLFLKNK